MLYWSAKVGLLDELEKIALEVIEQVGDRNGHMNEQTNI